jgi:prephenate dehydratase
MIIPFHIRDYLGLKEGTELIVSNNGVKELKIFPLLENTAEIEIIIYDTPGSLAKILDNLATQGVDVLMSSSKIIERGKLAEWSAIIDIKNCKNPQNLQKELNHMDIVKKATIYRK